MAAIYEATGLNINASTPVMKGDAWEVSLQDAISAYSHEITSDHGFDSATVSFAVNRNDVSGWLSRGLGMDIDVRDRSGVQVWNGFVDNVSANEGARRTSVGRLTETANRIAVAYAEVIEGADEPVMGGQMLTEYVNDTDSQDVYGIWERVISGGSRTTTEANQIRDVVLSRYAYPPASYDIAASGNIEVSLKCLGYYKWLEAFTYQDLTNDDVTTDGKLLLVLAAEAAVNNVLSTDYTRIETSSAYVGTFEDQNRTGFTIAHECASFGDASDNLWTFGVYEDRQVVFDVVPGSIAYAHRRGTGPIVERLGGGVMDPWSVRAGQWLFLPDSILGGEELPIPNTRAQFYKDKRIAFIERVSYNAPYGFSAQGTKIGRANQQLARWGLGAI